MKNKNRFIIFAITVSMVAIARVFFSQASSGHYLWLLKPVAMLTGFITGFSFFETPAGFANEHLKIVIDKSCSGLNFLYISILLTSFQWSFRQNLKQKISHLAGLFILCFFITILANSLRISSAIAMAQWQKVNQLNIGWLHHVEGAFVFFFSLVLYQGLLSRLLFSKNETPTPTTKRDSIEVLP